MLRRENTPFPFPEYHSDKLHDLRRDRNDAVPQSLTHDETCPRAARPPHPPR